MKLSLPLLYPFANTILLQYEEHAIRQFIFAQNPHEPSNAAHDVFVDLPRKNREKPTRVFRVITRWIFVENSLSEHFINVYGVIIRLFFARS